MSAVLAPLLAAVAAAALAFAMRGGLSAGTAHLRTSAAERPAEAFADMFVFVDARRLFAFGLAVATAVAVTIALLTRAAPLALASAACVLVLPRLTQRLLQRRRRRALALQLPEALTSLAAELRVGAAVGQALGGLASRAGRPLSLEVELALRKQRLGIPLQDAVRQLAERTGLPEYQLFATALALGVAVGGGIADTFERLAETLRRKLALEGKITALTAQGRLQAVVVSGLPVVLLGALQLVDPAAMRPMYTSVPGLLVLAAIVVLELSGWWLLRRIATIEV